MINVVPTPRKLQYAVSTSTDMTYRLNSSSNKYKTLNMTLRTRLTRSSSKNLITPYENPKQKFRSSRKLSRIRSIDRLDSSESNLFSDYVDQLEEEETEIIGEPTMEEYMTKTRDD
ncbi:hypothetical protein Tco_1420350 [Tanacetum coccineum]